MLLERHNIVYTITIYNKYIHVVYTYVLCVYLVYIQ